MQPGEQEEHTECDPGPSPCFYAPFGLSDGDGDAVFLAEGDTILSGLEYPAGGAPEPQTWCRLPDGSNTLGVCEATPGSENAAAP